MHKLLIDLQADLHRKSLYVFRRISVYMDMSPGGQHKVHFMPPSSAHNVSLLWNRRFYSSARNCEIEIEIEIDHTTVSCYARLVAALEFATDNFTTANDAIIAKRTNSKWFMAQCRLSYREGLGTSLEPAGQICSALTRRFVQIL